jgi:hypothetical protein
MVEEKLRYDATTICSVTSYLPSGKRREPILLCEETYEISQYIGLHCKPMITVDSKWMYCFVIESPSNPDIFKKIILEKEENTLVVKYPPYSDYSLLLVLFKICFNMCKQPLVNIRRKMMIDVGTFAYDTIAGFTNSIRNFACDSYRIEQGCDAMFCKRL